MKPYQLIVACIENEDRVLVMLSVMLACGFRTTFQRHSKGIEVVAHLLNDDHYNVLCDILNRSAVPEWRSL
jgi:hypothetical protein